MRRVVVNMQSRLLCSAISETLLRSGNGFVPYTVESPDKVADECKWIAPFALLMEVTGYIPWNLCDEQILKGRLWRSTVKHSN